MNTTFPVTFNKSTGLILMMIYSYLYSFIGILDLLGRGCIKQ
jgi:hypothetical protein